MYIFCLFVTHAIIVICDSLDTHTRSHLIYLFLKGLHCKMTPIDGCSSGYSLFLNRDFLASILCDLNTIILKHTNTFNTLASSYLEIQNISKLKQWNTNKVKTIAQYVDLCRCFFLKVNWQTNNSRVLCKTIERNRRSELCSEYLALGDRKKSWGKLNETFLTYNSCSIQTLSVKKKRSEYYK